MTSPTAHANMRRAERGLTLAELLIASTLAMVVMLGIMTMESGRSRMEGELHERSGLTSTQGEAGRATVVMANFLANSDRVKIVSPSHIELRAPIGCWGAGVPAPGCFDNPANYGWEQFKLNGTTLEQYQGNCGSMIVLARNITALAFARGSNNVIQYTLTWNNGSPGPQNRTHQFSGQVVVRGAVEPGLFGTAADSGLGLDVENLSPPPGPC